MTTPRGAAPGPDQPGPRRTGSAAAVPAPGLPTVDGLTSPTGSAVSRALGNDALLRAVQASASSTAGDSGPPSGGAPLPIAELARWSRVFGHDLGDVRLHTGAGAGALARGQDALAYTQGEQVVLGDGWVPGTPEGDALLAHELAHVVQQDPSRSSGRSDAAPAEAMPDLEDEADRAAQRALHGLGAGRLTALGPGPGGRHHLQRKVSGPTTQLPPQPVPERSRLHVWDQATLSYWANDDIQWYIPMSNWVPHLDLIVWAPPERVRKLTDTELAIACAAVLFDATGLEPLPGAGAVAGHVRDEIRTFNLKGAWVFRVGVDNSLLAQDVGKQVYDDWWQQLKAANPGWRLRGALLASGDLTPPGSRNGGTRGPGDPGGDQEPDWVRRRRRALEQHLSGADPGHSTRTLGRGPAKKPDVPSVADRVVPWFNDRDGSWYLNVWVSLGPGAAGRRAEAIRLSPEESDEDLRQRVDAAAAKAWQRGEDRDRQAAAEMQAPPWAVALYHAVHDRLEHDRARRGHARDLPDGEVLVAGAADGSGVRLQIWVERLAGHGTERNAGAVPLAEHVDVEQVVAYARRLAAMLREFERAAPGSAPPPDQDLATELGKGPGSLTGFPARLVPEDLREDRITVTDAENRFSLYLDFGEVYGSEDLLFVASKLYSQRFYVYWEVYPAPADLPPAAGVAPAPGSGSPASTTRAAPSGGTEPSPAAQSWLVRWKALYDAFNPRDEHGIPVPRTVTVSGKPLTSTDGDDLTTRVRMPGKPGDYVVRAVVVYRRFGDEGLTRAPSEAWYPVQVHELDTEAGGAASTRADAIARLERALSAEKGGQDDQATTGRPERERQLLKAVREADRQDLDRLRAAESGSVPQNVARDLAQAANLLARAERLEAMLPQLQTADRPPSVVLADRPDLASVYWYAVARAITVPALVRSLRQQQVYLRGLQQRGMEFSKHMDPVARQYAPEVAFVSDLTGQVSPLVLMVGEATAARRSAIAFARNGLEQWGVSVRDAPGTAVVLADVTASETAKEYVGYSSRPRSEGGYTDAVDDAFDQFGRDATYGPGKVAVRFPGDPSAGVPDGPRPGIHLYRSHEGFKQKALRMLGIIALLAGTLALGFTIVGAPGAALLGAAAAASGAVVAVNNIGEREARHTLRLDAELGLDVIAIIGILPVLSGLSRLGRAASEVRLVDGVAHEVRLAGGSAVAIAGPRFLKIYTWAERGATMFLIPRKLAEDIQRIEALDIPTARKQQLIQQAQNMALFSGVMAVGSVVAHGIGGLGEGGGRPPVGDDPPDVQDQIKLLEREGFGDYETPAAVRDAIEAGEAARGADDPGASSQTPAAGTRSAAASATPTRVDANETRISATAGEGSHGGETTPPAAGSGGGGGPSGDSGGPGGGSGGNGGGSGGGRVPPGGVPPGGVPPGGEPPGGAGGGGGGRRPPGATPPESPDQPTADSVPQPDDRPSPGADTQAEAGAKAEVPDAPPATGAATPGEPTLSRRDAAALVDQLKRRLDRLRGSDPGEDRRARRALNGLNDLQGELDTLRGAVKAAATDDVSDLHDWIKGLDERLAKIEELVPEPPKPVTVAEEPEEDVDPLPEVEDPGDIDREEVNPTDKRDWPAGWNTGDFQEAIPRMSGADRASDLPSWAEGARPRVGETPNRFAGRILGYRYPGRPGSTFNKGATSDWQQLKKFARGYRDPVAPAPAQPEGHVPGPGVPAPDVPAPGVPAPGAPAPDVPAPEPEDQPPGGQPPGGQPPGPDGSGRDEPDPDGPPPPAGGGRRGGGGGSSSSGGTGSPGNGPAPAGGGGPDNAGPAAGPVATGREAAEAEPPARQAGPEPEGNAGRAAQVRPVVVAVNRMGQDGRPGWAANAHVVDGLASPPSEVVEPPKAATTAGPAADVSPLEIPGEVVAVEGRAPERPTAPSPEPAPAAPNQPAASSPEPAVPEVTAPSREPAATPEATPQQPSAPTPEPSAPEVAAPREPGAPTSEPAAPQEASPEQLTAPAPEPAGTEARAPEQPTGPTPEPAASEVAAPEQPTAPAPEPAASEVAAREQPTAPAPESATPEREASDQPTVAPEGAAPEPSAAPTSEPDAAPSKGRKPSARSIRREAARGRLQQILTGVNTRIEKAKATEARTRKTVMQLKERIRTLIAERDAAEGDTRAALDREIDQRTAELSKNDGGGYQDELTGATRRVWDLEQYAKKIKGALTLTRPGLRAATKRAIMELCREEQFRDGRWHDASTDRVITDKVVFGHKPGFEHWRLAIKAVEQGMTGLRG